MTSSLDAADNPRFYQRKTMIYYIGIHGPKRVGKDLFAANLSRFIGTTDRDRGDHVTTDRLADPLYRWVSEITGWTVGRLMGREKDTPFTEETVDNKSLIGRTPRSLLLDQGLFVREKYGQYLLNHCLEVRSRSIYKRIPSDLWVFVPDVRTEVEADMMTFMFDLSRDGCHYENTVTEHALGRMGMYQVHLKTCDDASQACDFKKLHTKLLSLKDLK